MARKAGEWVGKIQRLAAGVKQELAANGEYAELSKVKQDFTSTVADLKQELHDFGKQVEQETQPSPSTRKSLPSKRARHAPRMGATARTETPADFGISETAQPRLTTRRSHSPCRA